MLPRWRSPSSFQALFLRSDPSSVSNLARKVGLAHEKQERELETALSSRSKSRFPSLLEKSRESGSKSEKKRRAGNFFSFILLPAPRWPPFRHLFSLLSCCIEASHNRQPRASRNEPKNEPKNEPQNKAKQQRSPCTPRRPWPWSSSSTTSSSEGCPTCPRPCYRAAAPALARRTWRGRRPAGPSSQRWRPCP